MITSLGITSTNTVPLVTANGVVGAIQFVTAESLRRYGADDGITDVRPPFALDEAELLDLVRSACDGAADAEAVATNMIAHIESVLPIHDRHDDLAIVVVRVARSVTS